MKQTLCIDCGKRISPIASRCKSCSNKFRAGKYNHKNRKPPSKETITVPCLADLVPIKKFSVWYFRLLFLMILNF